MRPRSTDVAQSMAAGVLRGQAAERELRTADGLTRGSQAVIDAASRLGCSYLLPASDDARGVVAVAVALGRGDVREVDLDDVRSGAVDKVLVVESVAVSGRRVRLAATRSRAAGAAWVGGVVVAATGDKLDSVRLGVDDLACAAVSDTSTSNS